ncbi:MAG: hypothetical protein M1835_003209 [Candelina submexicana]|nr:MAG: hypothetical protein M1835_003209 [Candelina submexicana]
MYFSFKYYASVALLYPALQATAGPIPETTELESIHAKRAGVPRKRGLLFGSESSAQQTTDSNLFTGSTSQVAWASNYGQTRGGIVQYIGLNEPDVSQTGQVSITPAAAAAGFKQYMQPFAGKIKLGGPAISGQGSLAFTWLSQFYAACSGCTIDFQPFHVLTSSGASVASSVAYIESYTNQAISASGGRPVWLSELALNGASTNDKISILQQVMPWLDNNANVFRYAYFYVADLVTNNVLNTLGNVYNTYT